jgi:hypothetical protein
MGSVKLEIILEKKELMHESGSSGGISVLSRHVATRALSRRSRWGGGGGASVNRCLSPQKVVRTLFPYQKGKTNDFPF